MMIRAASSFEASIRSPCRSRRDQLTRGLNASSGVPPRHLASLPFPYDFRSLRQRAMITSALSSIAC